MRSSICEALSSKAGHAQSWQQHKTKQKQTSEAILCVFIVDMTLHLFEMMYKKCNRTENGFDEVELPHRLAGFKTTLLTNKPRKI